MWGGIGDLRLKKKKKKKKREPFLIFYSKTTKNFTGGIDKSQLYRVCLAKTCTEQSSWLLILKLVKSDDVI
jgi:hypothetical protein